MSKKLWKIFNTVSQRPNCFFCPIINHKRKQNPDFLNKITIEMREFLEFNSKSGINPHILWEVTKCCIRGICTSFSSHQSREHKSKFIFLENEISRLKSLQKSFFSENRQRELSTVKSEFKSLTCKAEQRLA